MNLSIWIEIVKPLSTLIYWISGFNCEPGLISRIPYIQFGSESLLSFCCNHSCQINEASKRQIFEKKSSKSSKTFIEIVKKLSEKNKRIKSF